MSVNRSCVHLGLTGGIGSGKSTVAKFFEQMGATVIDADAISRAATAANGSAIEAIASAFGPEYVGQDGALVRDRMRALVYADRQAKSRLEAIVHPIVHADVVNQAEMAALRGSPCVVYDIPLLVESGRWRASLDRVLVVDCSRETQSQRVQRRDGLSIATIDSILAAQASRIVRLRSADIVIYNDGIDTVQLKTLVHQVWSEFGL